MPTHWRSASGGRPGTAKSAGERGSVTSRKEETIGELRIRPVKSEDLPALVEVEVSASSRYQEAGFSPDEAPPRDEQDLHRLAHETTLLVAELDGIMVGYCSFFRLGPYLHLEELAVSRAWQGRGIGRRLAEAYLQVARSMSECSHCSLIAFREAPWAVGLYRHLGFLPRHELYAPLPRTDLLDRLVEREAASGLDPSMRIVMLRPRPNPSIYKEPEEGPIVT